MEGSSKTNSRRLEAGIAYLMLGLALLPMTGTALQQGASGDQLKREYLSGSERASESEFTSIDNNNNPSLDWQEIRDSYGPALDQRGWDKRYVLETFDHDDDDTIDQEEHRMLIVSLEVTDPDRTASAIGAGSEAADSRIPRSLPGVISNPQEESNATLAQGAQGRRGGAESEKGDAAGPAKPTIYDLWVRDLEGRKVVNASSETLGKVKQLVKHQQTGELGLVVSSGGLLGFGSTDLLLDLNKLDISPELKLVWNGDEDAADLREVAAYRESDYVPVTVEGPITLRSVADEVRSEARQQ